MILKEENNNTFQVVHKIKIKASIAISLNSKTKYPFASVLRRRLSIKN